jgi:AraC-like DNA-binding protein
MKPQLLKVPKAPSTSFNARRDRIPNINNNWHYHSELELIHFHKGQGMQFVGDNMKNFGPGDIVLIGSNLPHFWKYDEIDEKPGKEEPTVAYSTVIHFTENFWGDCFLNLPETATIKSIIKKAQRGILAHEKEVPHLAAELDKIYSAEGVERIIALIRCLSEFADNSNKTKLLSSLGFRYEFNTAGNDRINAVYDFTLKNFKNTILLEKVSSIANMAVNSFCRYFKTKTGKSYMQFLNELRIGYACKLLIDNRYSVKQICFESGFKNFTSFHKIFKKNKGKTPQQYFKEYLNKV